MGRKDTSFFSFFGRKKRKLTPKQQNELAMEQARAMSDKMAKDKEEIRELFLQKILENAKIRNEAERDFIGEDEKPVEGYKEEN